MAKKLSFIFAKFRSIFLQVNELDKIGIFNVYGCKPEPSSVIFFDGSIFGRTAHVVTCLFIGGVYECKSHVNCSLCEHVWPLVL